MAKTKTLNEILDNLVVSYDSYESNVRQDVKISGDKKPPIKSRIEDLERRLEAIEAYVWGRPE